MTARTAIVAEANLVRGRRLQHLLASAGCEPLLARNGDEVLPLLRRTPAPAVAVVNAMMPRRTAIFFMAPHYRCRQEGRVTSAG